MSPGDSGTRYRLFASHCLAIAQETPDPARKLALLDMAQAWVVLAEQGEGHGFAGEAHEPDRQQPRDDPKETPNR
jgi:hypothetical protein